MSAFLSVISMNNNYNQNWIINCEVSLSSYFLKIIQHCTNCLSLLNYVFSVLIYKLFYISKITCCGVWRISICLSSILSCKKNSGIILEMSIRFYFYHIISLSPTQEMNKKTMISHTCILHVLFALKWIIHSV